jgi:molybdate transport system substrate-binding protein
VQTKTLKRLLLATLLVGVSNLTCAAEITVSAAASLTNAFKEIAQNYQAQYPDAKVS